ncbi:MAG: MerR family transcriptional regulator, partial [Lachnospiraceae bacterium]|nr:MerR family transcriptional regulator [Lachnospiraceae bacterium]
MMTVNEVSKLTGVSIRALHHYDKIGLLRPSDISQSGYRLYDDQALERLQQILLFRELEFSLKDIGRILDSDSFDQNAALTQQIELLTLKKEHLENLIIFARGLKMKGVDHMDFTAFDTKKIDEYTARAKEQWGNSDAYKEFEQKTTNRSIEEENLIAQGLMTIFVEFGDIMDSEPTSEKVQSQVKKLQDYITQNY